MDKRKAAVTKVCRRRGILGSVQFSGCPLHATQQAWCPHASITKGKGSSLCRAIGHDWALKVPRLINSDLPMDFEKEEFC